jgi:hypothetical protein
VWRVNGESRDEITASVAAHAELGPRYDNAVAEGLVDRIGEEIDKRVEARLRGLGAPSGHAPGPAVPPPPAPSPATHHRGGGVSGVVLGLGSIGLGVGVTAVVTSSGTDSVAKVFILLLIWMAIVAVNVAHARRH